HHLVNIAADREGLHADQDEIDTIIASSGGVDGVAEGVGITPERVVEVVTDQVLLQQLGEQYMDRLTVHLTGTIVVEESPEETAEEQARALGERLAANPA